MIYFIPDIDTDIAYVYMLYTCDLMHASAIAMHAFGDK